MFAWLFNQPLTVWRDSTLVLASGWAAYWWWAAAGLLLMGLALSLWRQPLALARRTGLFLQQSLVALTALTMLFRPALSVDVAQAFDSAVAWVIDTSDSMQRQDAGENGNSSRTGALIDALQRAQLPAASGFDNNLYALGRSLTPIDSVTALDEPGSATDQSAIADGLDGLMRRVNDQSLAAVVLMSDGANNAGRVDADWWRRLQAAGVPIHTIGVGRPDIVNDVELADVIIEPVSSAGSSFKARLVIRHQGSQQVRLRVMSAGELLLAEDVPLSSDASETQHVVTLNSGTAGVRELEFSIRPDGPDDTPLNNRQTRVLQVQDRSRRVLYVEGEPRWEYKFMRRALEAQPGIEIVSLLRTSPNKFYRQGVHDADELAGGFPAQRDQLFAYDAVVIGSLDAAQLNTDQQAALRDFVSERGGSLLMLAGRSGLADGGWARSAVGAALPVTLSSRLNANTYRRERVQVLPTRQGLRSDWLWLDSDEEANLEAWRGLPAVADSQALGTAKPGAVTVLETDAEHGRQPLMIWQRYGRGATYVLGTSGTWRWQMGLPSEDQRHERFWRQLLGHLVDSAMPRVAIESADAVVRGSNRAAVSVMAFDADYQPLVEGDLAATITGANNVRSDVVLQADRAVPGRYQLQPDSETGETSRAEDGPRSLSVALPPSGESASSATARAEHWWVHESGNAEAFGQQQHQDFLMQVAASTGGRYLPLAELASLPDVLGSDNAAPKRQELLPLWHMPAFFLLMLLCKGVEWCLRLRWNRL